MDLRSHDQFQTSHCSTPPPKKKKKKIGPYVNFFFPDCLQFFGLQKKMFNAKKKKMLGPLPNFFLTEEKKWCQCFYLHRSRDSVSPVCGIFFGDSNFLDISVTIRIHLRVEVSPIMRDVKIA